MSGTRRLRQARTLSEADLALWAAYARLVLPMAGRAAPAPPAAAPPIPAAAAPSPAAVPAPVATVSRVVPGPTVVRAAPLIVGLQPPGVDAATWQKLRSGKLGATRTLDLHGRTAQRAFHALHGFLRTAHVDRQRVVEVITGRGSGDGGVIRREFPLWLNLYELRPMVLAAAHPMPAPGLANLGSVRLLLRKPR